jgi:hypothetical protein
VWGGSIMGGWWGGKERSEGSISAEDISSLVFWERGECRQRHFGLFIQRIREGACLKLDYNYISTMSKDKEFEKILQEAEDPKNIGQGSWACPENPTPSEKAKYELCEKILGYQEDNNLSDEIMTRKLHLSQTELEDILFCRISKFNLDYLMNVASKLFLPDEIKLIVEPKKENLHARAV